MGRMAIWTSIRDTLTRDIAAGRYLPGDKLPTEAALAARFDVNRHTVRRALAEMVSTGLVHTRRGSGAFVAAKPADYPLSRRVRFHQNLRAAGRLPSKQLLSIETRTADARETKMLELAGDAQVHAVENLSFADGVPVAHAKSSFPASRLPGFPDAIRNGAGITDALRACGVADYTRRWTRLTAVQAQGAQAQLLRVADDAALLRSESASVDPGGVPVEYGTTWFVGDRITLTLDAE